MGDVETGSQSWFLWRCRHGAIPIRCFNYCKQVFSSVSKSAGLLLLGDIGGSYARFALAEAGSLQFLHLSVVPCPDYASLELALDEFLKAHVTGQLAAICVAAAGPVRDQRISLTNNHWIVDGRSLSQRFGGVPVRLLNDFAAIAWSIPALQGDDLATVGESPTACPWDRDFTVAAIGPGTGLGMAGLLGRDGRLQVVAGEGGNAAFAPESELQLAVLQQLRKQSEFVSIEQLVSGAGLENLYGAICSMKALPVSGKSAADIFADAKSGEDAVALQAVELFFEVLGQAAGNLALTMGAIDGIYIAGGIVPRYRELLLRSKFRAGFENKGRYQAYLQAIPTQLIVHPQPGLLGAGRCAQELLRDDDGHVRALGQSPA
jgi:glucokinase